MRQKPSLLAKTVLTLGLLSFVLLVAGVLLIDSYPPNSAEEVGVLLLDGHRPDDHGPDVLALGWLLGFLTLVLWVVFKLFHRKSGKAGKGLAATGVLFGCISIFGGFVYFPGKLVPGYRQPRPAEEVAISAVRNIITSQITYSATIGQGSYAPSLTALQNARLITNSGTLDGYRFLITAGPIDDQGKITTYSVVASPVEYGVTGWANFYSDESGVTRYTVEDRPAWVKDTSLNSLP